MAEVISMEELRPSHAPAWGFALLLGVMALAAGSKAILYDTLDPDLFWHLRVADEIARQPFPRPLVDDLSFASLKTPWTPYSWLAELGMKRLWDAGGYRAAVVALSLMSASLVSLIALIALEWSIAQCGRPRYLAAEIAAFAGGFLALPYLSFRPVTAALVLLAAAVWLLVRDRRMDEKSHAVWLVIPLTALLVNIHLYAIFVPLAVLGLFLGTAGRSGRYAILAAASLTACAATPMLPGVVRTAWHYQFSDVMVGAHVIAEMQPFYHGPLGGVAAAIALIVIGSALWNRRVMSAVAWLWMIGSAIALLRLGRFAPIFAIFAVPTLAATLPELNDAVLGRRWVRGTLAVALLAGCVRIAFGLPAANVPLSQWINRMGVDNSGYPTAAADFVQTHVPAHTHRVISEFTWGGYLEWRLGSRWQVLMDGRTQLFSEQFWRMLYLGSEQDRKAYLATITADAAVVSAQGSEFRRSLLELGWRVVYADQRAQVLQPSRVLGPPSPFVTSRSFTSTTRTPQCAAARDNAS